MWVSTRGEPQRVTSVLVIMVLALTTWCYYVWLTRNAVVAGIFMSWTLVLAGLLAGALALVA